jgi:hypothetical protein
MLCKIWGFHGSDYEGCRLVGYKNPVSILQGTQYICNTEPSLLVLCEIWGFHVGDYEECRPLLCHAVFLQEPHCVTSQKTAFFHYHVQKGPPRLSVLKQFNIIHDVTFKYKSILILSIIHVRLGFVSSTFPSDIAIKVLYAFLLSPSTRATYHAHLILLWLDHSNFTLRTIQIMSLFFMQFSSTSSNFISLRSKYSYRKTWRCVFTETFGHNSSNLNIEQICWALFGSYNSKACYFIPKLLICLG